MICLQNTMWQRSSATRRSNKIFTSVNRSSNTTFYATTRRKNAFCLQNTILLLLMLLSTIQLMSHLINSEYFQFYCISLSHYIKEDLYNTKFYFSVTFLYSSLILSSFLFDSVIIPQWYFNHSSVIVSPFLCDSVIVCLW